MWMQVLLNVNAGKLSLNYFKNKALRVGLSTLVTPPLSLIVLI
jgi:hypothetical protein